MVQLLPEDLPSVPMQAYIADVSKGEIVSNV